MGKARHPVGRPTSLNATPVGAMAWAERLRAEDRLDLNIQANRNQLGLPGAYDDKPPRAKTISQRPRTASEPQLGKLHRLLRAADAGGTGLVDTQELRFLATRSGLDLDDERTATLLAASEPTRDGRVEYALFERGVRRQHAEASGADERPPATPASARASARSPPFGTPRDSSLLPGSENPYASALFLRYKHLRMLQPANLQLPAPPNKVTPNTSHLFHDNVYRTKNRSLKSWQDFQDRHNVLTQRPNTSPGVPTFRDTLSTYQLHFTHGGSTVDPGAYSAQGDALSRSLRNSTRTMATAAPFTRTLHTSHGLAITRSSPAVERDYTRDPAARMTWRERAGWTP
ncbi:hypothetical protein KFE25_004269 [Diacronema lutheri]|uniref:EF-hand domain-containing protein n=1 Tax=Diacronema lutheri TaxID=2081491 RepID=A0A8J5XFF8_DIALT|nr:hypothetical protein KFE25_004269 [Diacronema lutheri]